MFLDFSPAFDVIDHQLLLNKLKSKFFIDGKALKWFESFLTGRTFKVNIENKLSRSVAVESGVPQGSVLGPKFFSLYSQEISNITDKYNFNMHIFADDIQIYFETNDSNTNLTELINCYEEIKKWANTNFLKLNENKTKFLSISSKRSKFSSVNSQIIQKFPFDSKVRNLGVIIDHKLKFDAQINKVCKSGYNLLRNLRRISGKLTNTSLKIQIIQACILSHVDYCNSLYLNLPDVQIKKLQRLVNTAIRFIYNIKFTDDYSITELMQKCHFLPIRARIEFKINLLVFKCWNGLAPNYLQKLIHPKTSLNSLRIHSDRFLLELPKLYINNQKNRGFSQSAPDIWNNLPLCVRESENIAIFKSRLKTYLFSKYFSENV